MPSGEAQYLDVLQNIEFGIVATYRAHGEISDYDVMRTLEALIDRYTAEKIGRPPRDFSFPREGLAMLTAIHKQGFPGEPVVRKNVIRSPRVAFRFPEWPQIPACSLEDFGLHGRRTGLWRITGLP